MPLARLRARDRRGKPPRPRPPRRFAFFTAHQAAVVREATARIIPGPTDDPLEVGHPGAREANVVRFVDVLLSALDHHPEHLYGGGPFGAAANQFVSLSTQQRRGWETRIAKLKKARTAPASPCSTRWRAATSPPRRRATRTRY